MIKIIEKTYKYKDYRKRLNIKVYKNKELVGSLNFCEGEEPRNDSLSRNFNDCYNISNLLIKILKDNNIEVRFESENSTLDD